MEGGNIMIYYVILMVIVLFVLFAYVALEVRTDQKSSSSKKADKERANDIYLFDLADALMRTDYHGSFHIR